MREQLDDLALAIEDRIDTSSRNTLRYIILGLLWAHPMSGYDIKQAFDRALASYWNAGNSQIYTTLKRLSQEKLVESEVIVQTTRPNRKVYRLTDAGQLELDRWLQEDVPARFTKDEFLTKLFFCGETSDEIALRHLREHHESLHSQLTHMEWVRQQYATRPTRRPRLLEYQMLVREYKEALLKTGLEVTERFITRIEDRANSPD
ncbi:PadR family transcriptional regulator [Ktedonosporobacter rubrisoli]|uniref:PadR family transcriptional regulator n=1 Tax=Ktedonosporobacter rubrisoli TaxID=2509675 RepID=A0A4P6JVT5_KTERU|nr:PadR family transcriptional regulator [Ktedonosporobacter rubrisoli]QBD79555.1 PadR family transcriptional regulator [Ktedonosporobacter rubrisoli]